MQGAIEHQKANKITELFIVSTYYKRTEGCISKNITKQKNVHVTEVSFFHRARFYQVADRVLPLKI